MNKVRALSCEIFTNKSYGNCSNNGISNRYKEVYVLCDDGNVVIDLDNPPENLVVFEARDYGFTISLRFKPYSSLTDGKWYMFGGDFVWCCDSRFREVYGHYPIPLHDRVE